MPIPKEALKASFKTNTGAFLLNNVVMSVLSLSSLVLVASNYSHYGLLGDMNDGALKWILSFVLLILLFMLGIISAINMNGFGDSIKYIIVIKVIT